MIRSEFRFLRFVFVDKYVVFEIAFLLLTVGKGLFALPPPNSFLPGTVLDVVECPDIFAFTVSDSVYPITFLDVSMSLEILALSVSLSC